MRQAGAASPAVRSFVVGRDLGADFEWAAVYVVEDLGGYWEYLTYPAHVHSEMKGIPLLARFKAFDVTDSNDPEIGDKNAGLQRRNFAEHPRSRLARGPGGSFRVPDGKGWPASQVRSRRYARNGNFGRYGAKAAIQGCEQVEWPINPRVRVPRGIEADRFNDGPRKIGTARGAIPEHR